MWLIERVKMRERVLFLHVMKCGGTTLRHLLANEYPHDEIAPVPIGTESEVTPPYPHTRHDVIEYMLALSPQNTDAYRLVMSHYDWRVVDRVGDDWHLMTMLRHPVRQLLSRYYFIRRARDLHGDEWERTCAEGFHHWLLYHARPYANQQTRMLGNGQVEKAIANIQHPRMTIGLVECFAESVERFNTRFGWTLPDPPRYNQADVTTDEIGLCPETIALAEQVQAMDMKLYETACEMFMKE